MVERVSRAMSVFRPWWAVGLIGAGLMLAGGCARQNTAIATQPTPEELPVLQENEPAIAANVVVEGRRDLPRQPLVPKLEPPKLTPAEQAVMGEEPVHYKFLEYNELWTPPGSFLGPWYGGVLTASHDYLNVVGIGGPESGVSAVSGWGGARTGVDPIGCSVSSTYSTGTGVVITGPASGVRVETDPEASTVARHKKHRER